MKKEIKSMLLLGVIPVSALALVLHCLETYDSAVHNESSLLVCGYSIAALILSTIVWHRMSKQNRAGTVLWTLSAVVLIFVFYVGSKIPFCVVCDRVTAEDLGFLIHWIKPELPPNG